MEKKEIICTECPNGCEITVELDGSNVKTISGNLCKRGKEYAENEIECPRRVLTTTIKCSDGKVVPVKSDKPVKRSEIFMIMDKINRFVHLGDVKRGDIIIRNITEDINIIATDDKW